jgi:hypothetical protein
MTFQASTIFRVYFGATLSNLALATSELNDTCVQPPEESACHDVIKHSTAIRSKDD